MVVTANCVFVLFLLLFPA